MVAGLCAEVTHVLLDPRAVGLARREFGFDLAVFEEDAVVRLDEDHLAGAEFAAHDDAPIAGGDGARFRRRADEAVFGDEVAARAQAVAIERRAHRLAVGEDERRRAVPRFGETGVIGVEVADVLRQIGRLLPRLRREHGDRVADVAPAEQQQFDGVVEHRRIAAGGVDDGANET